MNKNELSLMSFRQESPRFPTIGVPFSAKGTCGIARRQFRVVDVRQLLGFQRVDVELFLSGAMQRLYKFAFFVVHRIPPWLRSSPRPLLATESVYSTNRSAILHSACQ